MITKKSSSISDLHEWNQVIVHKQQLSPTERHNLQTWSTYFHSYLVEHYYDILGSVEETPTGPGGAKEQTTGAMCLSVEIWRMKLLLNYHRLASLKDWKIRDSPFLVEWLLETPGVRLDHPPKEPILKTQKDGSTTQKQRDDHKEAVNKFRQAMAIFEAQKKIDTIPVLQLKQTQVRPNERLFFRPDVYLSCERSCGSFTTSPRGCESCPITTT